MLKSLNKCYSFWLYYTNGSRVRRFLHEVRNVLCPFCSIGMIVSDVTVVEQFLLMLILLIYPVFSVLQFRKKMKLQVYIYKLIETLNDVRLITVFLSVSKPILDKHFSSLEMISYLAYVIIFACQRSCYDLCSWKSDISLLSVLEDEFSAIWFMNFSSFLDVLLFITHTYTHSRLLCPMSLILQRYLYNRSHRNFHTSPDIKVLLQATHVELLLLTNS
jgi:hypothetical protein